MDRRPGARSVLALRPSIDTAVSVASRASKFLHKVSHIRIRLPLSPRKIKHEKPTAESVYPNLPRSRDGLKPYMSQPLLANVRVEMGNAEGDDSCSHMENSATDCRRASLLGDGLKCPLSAQDAKPATSAALDPTTIDIDGLPAATEPHPTPFLSFAPRAPGKRRATSPPTIFITNLMESPNSSPQAPHFGNDRLWRGNTVLEEEIPGLPTARTLMRKLSRVRPGDTDIDLDQISPVSSEPSSQLSALPPTNTVISSETPPLVFRHTEGGPYHHTFPLTRRGTEPPSSLSTPKESHRFSLTLSDGTAVRFSPSMILHSPILPLNLPALPAIPAIPVLSDSRHAMASMPALPQTGFRSEDDDDDVIAEDDTEDEPGDHIVDEPDLSNASASASASQPSEAPVSRAPPRSRQSSMSSSQEGEGYFTPLPEPDASRIDLSLISNLLPPPMSRDRKGKGRAMEQHNETFDKFSPEGLRTRTLSSHSRNYLHAQARCSGRHEVGTTRVVSEGNISTAVYTLRPAEDTPNRGGRSPLVPLPSRSSLVSVRDVDMRTSMHSISSRPGMYKRASRSLIDLHAIETREQVEQMIKEGEEAAAARDEKRRSTKAKQRRLTAQVPGTPVDDAGDTPTSLLELVHEIDDATPPSSDEAPGGVGAPDSRRVDSAPPYELLGNVLPLRRRRSMPMFTEASDPPPYPSFMHSYGLPPNARIQPRDDEGMERLPGYSNGIYIRAVIPRKMEFVAAGVQAKDRKWKKVLCILEGTVLKIYRPASASGVSAIGDWWERQVGAADVTGSHAAGVTRSGNTDKGIAPKLEKAASHERDIEGTGDWVRVTPTTSRAPTPTPTPSRFGFHLLKASRSHGRSLSDPHVMPPPREHTPRPSLDVSSQTNRQPPDASTLQRIPPPSFGHSSGSSAVTWMPKKSFEFTEPSSRNLIKMYTMQHAESGVGNDYTKRKNVIRVRVEGEQFLLQAKDSADVIAWIEALQASANIALDLDVRPMPKGPLFPRRRRRGPRRPAAVTSGAGDVQRTAVRERAAGRSTNMILTMVTEGF